MPVFYLTRRAHLDLLRIEQFSIEKWGASKTDQYMAELYEAFSHIAENPDIGRIRLERSFPFYMAPAGSHFAIYKVIDQAVIIATVLHGRRNIESILRSMAYKLTKEIEDMD